ncbi:fructosamine kinase [Salinigranum rubrum]|uniref:Fructosamine kinase n=2 Tax=Salinigranum rubrum TaxID=755307 RepID=A0A2I8VMH9_9EURY|nr:fructosamine kinase [Salinigranum rubrum]
MGGTRRTRVNSEETPVRERVGEVLGEGVARLEELDGGMVGTVHRVVLESGETLVAKTGDTPLDVEARMLRYLARHTSFPVPAVEYADAEVLVLAHVPGDTEHSPSVERDAADHLAALHGHTAGAFGFPFDTLSGPLRQPNRWCTSWVAFFGERRLGHVADVAHEAGTVGDGTRERLARVVSDLGALLDEPARPALVHGDVWTENVLSEGGAVTAFLDPACYYGHPEVELAYVAWTETFGDAFVERYRERRPVAPGFEERRRVYELLPLLEHVHLFGGRYRGLLDDALTRLGY